jgi:hypothetical protein
MYIAENWTKIRGRCHKDLEATSNRERQLRYGKVDTNDRSNNESIQN